MAIAAHFETDAQGTARSSRRTLRLEADGALPSGEATRVLVHNVSHTGLLIECAEALAPGEAILIDLPHAGATTARIVWSSGVLHGCQFDVPITSAALSAAELRSAVTPEQVLAPPAPASGRESFGARLQRLRKERGLTLTQIAETLAVSKPTVWAWEHDRSRPVENRLAPLAALLEVELAALMATRDPDALDRILARARAEIAAACGTDIGRVRIMVEL